MSRASGSGAAAARGGAAGRVAGATGGAWLVRAALIATILVFVPGLFEQFETPKAEVVRVLGIAALAAALAAPRAWGRWSWMDRAVAVWLGVEAITTLASVAPAISLLGSVPQREGLLTSLGLAGLYTAARRSAGEPGTTAGTLDAVLVAAATASLYGVLQAAGLDPSPWHATADYGPGHGFRRPFGTLGHANLLGVVVAIGLPVAWIRIAGARTGRWRLVVPALLAAAAELSLSRAAWLAAVAGSAVSLALLAAARHDAGGTTRGARRLTRRLLAPAGLAAIALAAGAAWFSGPLASRAAEIASTGGSGASRIEIWRGAIAAWRARPWLGHGPDTFDLVFPHVQPPGYWRLEWGLQPFHAHSIYLNALATRGVAGLLAGLLLALALAGALRAAWRAGGEARSLASAATGSFVALAVAGGFGALGIGGAAIAFVLAGLLAGAIVTPGERESRMESEPRAVPARAGGRSSARRGAGGVGRAAGAIAGAVALVWAGIELRASWAAGEARERLDGSPAAAAEAARRAAVGAPWEDVYSRMLAEALERAAAGSPRRATILADAERAARRAVAIAPRRALDHLRLGSVLAGSHGPADSLGGRAAVAEFDGALALAPADGVAWMEKARLELYLGRPVAAFEPAARAASLYPGRAEGHFLLAQSRLALGDTAGALTSLERALPADWGGREDERLAAAALRDRLRAGGSSLR